MSNGEIQQIITRIDSMEKNFYTTLTGLSNDVRSIQGVSSIIRENVATLKAEVESHDRELLDQKSEREACEKRNGDRIDCLENTEKSRPEKTRKFVSWLAGIISVLIAGLIGLMSYLVKLIQLVIDTGSLG